MSFSPVAKDARVLRQIDWLRQADFEVHCVGLGEPADGCASFLTLDQPNLLSRVFTYLFLSPQRRENLVMKSLSHGPVFHQLRSSFFEIVLINDLDFLATDELFLSASKGGANVFLDLHEYFFDLGGSLAFRLINKRYYAYLLGRLRVRSFNQILTVSEDIAALYERETRLSFAAVENASRARTTHLKPHWLGAEGKGFARGLEFVYHGNTGKGRGIIRLLFALRFTRTPLTLNLVLTTKGAKLLALKCFSLVIGVSTKTRFHKAVKPAEVVEYISQFDAEVIYYPPPHSVNELYSLPNKFFEALAAGLAVVVGPSVSMARIVNSRSCGTVLQDWKLRSLATMLDRCSLDRTLVNAWRGNSHAALEGFSEARTRSKFFEQLQIEQRES